MEVMYGTKKVSTLLCAPMCGAESQGDHGSAAAVAVGLVTGENEESHPSGGSCCPWEHRRGPEPAGSGQERLEGGKDAETKSEEVS